MGVEVNGGMIIGAFGSEIELPKGEESLNEWLLNLGMDSYAPHYDADEEDCIFGYTIDDVDVDSYMNEWYLKVVYFGCDFKELTGVSAKLYGAANVW